MAGTTLTLPERILALLFTKRDGSLLDEVPFRHALGGAILAELHAQDRIAFEDGASGHLVTPVSRQATGDPTLDDALGQLIRATRRGTATTWVDRFAEDDELYLRVARQLCRKDAVDEHEGRVRLIFRRTVYVDLAAGVRDEVVGTVRRAVTGDGPVEERTAAVIALARAADILKVVFDLDELAAATDRLVGMVDATEMDDHRRQALEIIVRATRTAVMEAAAAA